MKKLALFLICIAVMLSGCNSPEPVTEAAIKPLSELTLPEEFRLADDLAQLGGTLFALKDGAIYSCDLETGENVKLTDGEYKYCSVNGDRAYFYNPRLTNLKTCVCALINFTYESVKYFNFLGSCTIGIFD